MPVTFISNAGSSNKTILPINSLILRETSGAVTGLTLYTGLDAAYIMSSTSFSTSIEGSASHVHSQSATIASGGGHNHNVGVSLDYTYSNVRQSIGAKSTCWGHGHSASANSGVGGAHTHTVNSSYSTSADNAPPFYRLYWYKVTGDKYEAGTNDILMWYGSAFTFPAGFTLYTSMKNKFLKPGGAVQSGGSLSHSHTILELATTSFSHEHTITITSVEEVSANSSGWASTTTNPNGGADSHSHTASIGGASGKTTSHSHSGFLSGVSSSVFPTTYLYFIKKDANENKNITGAIIGWTGTTSDIPKGWSKLSSSYDNGLIAGYNHDTIINSSPSFTSGASHTHSSATTSGASYGDFDNHGHDSPPSTTSGTYSGGTVYKGAVDQPTVSIAPTGHKHTVTATVSQYSGAHTHGLSNILIGNDNSLPQHKKIILIMKV